MKQSTKGLKNSDLGALNPEKQSIDCDAFKNNLHFVLVVFVVFVVIFVVVAIAFFLLDAHAGIRFGVNAAAAAHLEKRATENQGSIIVETEGNKKIFSDGSLESWWWAGKNAKGKERLSVAVPLQIGLKECRKISNLKMKASLRSLFRIVFRSMP